MSDLTVCLVMIVKDEESAIGRCLRSVLPHVDHVVICDTGSTDATIQIAESFLCTEDVGYDIYQDEWVDFGHNRSLALERARGKADYLLLMDADMTLVVDSPLPDDGGLAYELNVLDPTDADFVYRLPALIRGDAEWRSEGVTHECLTPVVPWRPFDGWSLVHWCDGSRRPQKFIDDMILLEADHARDPDNERTVFYLAETYRHLGLAEKAIMYYELRSEMGGWQEEVYYSMFQLGSLICEHRGFGEGVKVLADCYLRFPRRAETLKAMSNAAIDVARKIDTIPDGLFIDRSSYVGVV